MTTPISSDQLSDAISTTEGFSFLKAAKGVAITVGIAGAIFAALYYLEPYLPGGNDSSPYTPRADSDSDDDVSELSQRDVTPIQVHKETQTEEKGTQTEEIVNVEAAVVDEVAVESAPVIVEEEVPSTPEQVNQVATDVLSQADESDTEEAPWYSDISGAEDEFDATNRMTGFPGAY